MAKRLNNEESISSVAINNINESNSESFKGIISVSKLLEYVAEKFDDEAKAKECEEKGKNNPKYKYAGMTAEEILKAWHDKADDSKHYGNMLDDYAGMRLNNAEKELALWKLDNNYEYDERLKANCQGFEDFYEMLSTKTNYKYVSREMKLFAISKKGNKVQGRFDCLFYDESNNSYILIDWKTTEDIKLTNAFGGKLKGPLYNLDDCAGNKYTLQLQLYKKALSETYKLTDASKISIYVCNVLRAPDPTTGKYYKLIKSNFQYNTEILDQVIDFANDKHKLLS